MVWGKKNLRKNFFAKKIFFFKIFSDFFCKPPSHDKQTDQQEEHGKELQRIKEAGEEELIETKTKLADMDKNVTTLNCQISTLRVFGWVKIQCAPKIAEIWSKKNIHKTELNPLFHNLKLTVKNQVSFPKRTNLKGLTKISRTWKQSSMV